jgi:hypothetical protein
MFPGWEQNIPKLGKNNVLLVAKAEAFAAFF